MELITRPYAFIYVDRGGDMLKESDFTSNEIINCYYNNNGFLYLNWNFYLIISKESVVESDFSEENIIENKFYTRKYVVEEKEIDNFINNLFPIPGEKLGKIKLIKGIDFNDATKKANDFLKENDEFMLLPSWHRDYSLMYSLNRMDLIRAALIKYPTLQYVFYTHLSNEYSIAEKKFKMFEEKDLEDENRKSI